jgi:hypothetical protein
MGSKLLLGRQSNLHLASHVILAKFNSETENASPHPVVHILDTGATFNVVRYEKYGRGALLDFSPHNLMSGRFERKIKELAIAIEEFTKAQ